MLIAVPGWPLPTFCTASIANTRTVSIARRSRSPMPSGRVGRGWEGLPVGASLAASAGASGLVLFVPVVWSVWLAVIGCGTPSGCGRGRWGRAASSERGVVQRLREVAGCVVDGGGAGLTELVVAETAGAHDDRRHAGLFRRLDVPHRVADQHARRVGRRAQLLQRHLQQVRRRLGRLDVVAAGP